MASLLETEIQESETTLNNKKRKLNDEIESEFNPYCKEFQKYLNKDVIKIVMKYSDYDFCHSCKELYFSCFSCGYCCLPKTCLSNVSHSAWLWSKDDVDLEKVEFNGTHNVYQFYNSRKVPIYYTDIKAKNPVIKTCDDGHSCYIIVDMNDRIVLAEVANLLKPFCKCLKK